MAKETKEETFDLFVGSVFAEGKGLSVYTVKRDGVHDYGVFAPGDEHLLPWLQEVQRLENSQGFSPSLEFTKEKDGYTWSVRVGDSEWRAISAEIPRDRWGNTATYNSGINLAPGCEVVSYDDSNGYCEYQFHKIPGYSTEYGHENQDFSSWMLDNRCSMVDRVEEETLAGSVANTWGWTTTDRPLEGDEWRNAYQQYLVRSLKISPPCAIRLPCHETAYGQVDLPDLGERLDDFREALKALGFNSAGMNNVGTESEEEVWISGDPDLFEFEDSCNLVTGEDAEVHPPFCDLYGKSASEIKQGLFEAIANAVVPCSFRGVDLTGLVAAGQNLSNIILTEANLEGADLRGCDLSGCDLSWANLEGANLEGAVLRRADMTGANVQSAKLAGADLTEVNLRESKGLPASLRDAKLSGSFLEGSDFAELISDSVSTVLANRFGRGR